VVARLNVTLNRRSVLERLPDGLPCEGQQDNEGVRHAQGNFATRRLGPHEFGRHKTLDEHDSLSRASPVRTVAPLSAGASLVAACDRAANDRLDSVAPKLLDTDLARGMSRRAVSGFAAPHLDLGSYSRSLGTLGLIGADLLRGRESEPVRAGSAASAISW
jgi:hypothetical protein